MLFKHRTSTLPGLGLLVLQVCFAQEQQPSSTVSNANSAGPTSSTAPPPASTTVISTITTTLASGQSLPSSLTASASQNGSVYYIPVITAIPLSSSTTSTAAPSSTTAATATTSPLVRSSDSALPLHTIIDPAFGVLGALLILAGLPMAFYGHRNRWSSYFLSGFFALALICISIILKVGVEPAVNPPSKAIRGLFLVAAVIAGALGGIISIVFWRGASFFACGLGGFFFGLFLQAVRSGGLIRPVGLRFILYIGLFAVFFTVSCIERVHSLTLAFATAIIGATALTLGIDCFSTQGLKEFYVRNLGFDALFSNKYPPTFQNSHFPLVQGMQIELGVLGAIILMGFAFQMRLWSDLRTQLRALKRSDERRNMRSKAERAARAVARTAKRDLEDWEARHGYSKTATRNMASRDEESGLPHEGASDTKDARSRTSSFMTLFRSNTDQLATPASYSEKLADSPAATSTLDSAAFPFPVQSGGRRSFQFLDYIQKGPERVEPEGPLKLDLPGITSPLGEFQASPISSASPDAILPSPANGPAGALAPGSSGLHAFQQTKSLDLTRASPPGPSTSVASFRHRSASTAALMENSASFMDLTPAKTEPAKIDSNASSVGADEASRNGLAAHRSQSEIRGPRSVLTADTPSWNQSAPSSSHERTFSTPALFAGSGNASALSMTQSSSYQGQVQRSAGPVYEAPYVERQQAQAQTSPLPSPGVAPAKIVSGGQSGAVLQARQALAMRRSQQPAVPWTNPGVSGGHPAPNTSSKAEVSPRTRAMSIQELEARHRAKLAALQAPATQTVHEADALRKAKEEWERKQRLERRRMQEREVQKQAAAAAAAAMGSSSSSGKLASPIEGEMVGVSGKGSREERRRSRNLSATLLEAVGEEVREAGGVDKAAEWRRSLNGVNQLDPRASRPSNPATPSSTRPTSPEPVSRFGQMTPNPFPAQPAEARKRLSEVDRRRLSQGAGSQRRQSQTLLDFGLPRRNE